MQANINEIVFLSCFAAGVGGLAVEVGLALGDDRYWLLGIVNLPHNWDVVDTSERGGIRQTRQT